MRKRTKKRGRTRRTKRADKRVNQDFREFKAQLKRWVDATRLTWTGVPYAQGSVYKFVLDDRLVKFILESVDRLQKAADIEAQRATLEMAESLRLASIPDPEDAVRAEPDADTEAAFEKFLTVSSAGGIIENDEAEASETEDGPRSPETAPGAEQNPGAPGPNVFAEGKPEPG